MKQADLAVAVEIKAAARALESAKQQGEAAVELIEAADLGRNMDFLV